MFEIRVFCDKGEEEEADIKVFNFKLHDLHPKYLHPKYLQIFTSKIFEILDVVTKEERKRRTSKFST